jgi:hypothetical protein
LGRLLSMAIFLSSDRGYFKSSAIHLIHQNCQV